MQNWIRSCNRGGPGLAHSGSQPLSRYAFTSPSCIWVFRSGFHQVEQGKCCPESIPETVVGKHITRQNLPVIRTVMHHLPAGIHFIKFSWETAWCGINRNKMYGSDPWFLPHFNPAKLLVPDIPGLLFYCFKIPASDFPQVQFQPAPG